MKDSYQKLISLIPKGSLSNPTVVRELGFIRNLDLADRYISSVEKAKTLGRKLSNKSNSFIGFLMGFANKPTGDLVMESYQSPPD